LFPVAAAFASRSADAQAPRLPRRWFFKQQRRNEQRVGIVVEPTAAAPVRRKIIRLLRVHAEQIADRVVVFQPVQAVRGDSARILRRFEKSGLFSAVSIHFHISSRSLSVGCGLPPAASSPPPPERCLPHLRFVEQIWVGLELDEINAALGLLAAVARIAIFLRSG
jgi:hypothetical protein